MTRKVATVWSLSVVGVAIVVYASVCLNSIRKHRREFRVEDALAMAAPIVLDRLRENATADPQRVLDAVLRMHHDGSVSPIWFDDSSAPVDAWGHRFRATADAASPPQWVACESAGPDETFGTGDDLVAKWPQ